MKKLQIGDLVEIETKTGVAYAQYTHENKKYGSLLHVFRKIYSERPEQFSELLHEYDAFVCFFPLKAALKMGIVSIAAHLPVPDNASAFPLFRTGLPDTDTRRVKVWWFWDGDKEWRVGDIDEQQRKLPIRGIWNYALLVERIESGWWPENFVW